MLPNYTSRFNLSTSREDLIVEKQQLLEALFPLDDRYKDAIRRANLTNAIQSGTQRAEITAKIDYIDRLIAIYDILEEDC